VAAHAVRVRAESTTRPSTADGRSSDLDIAAAAARWLVVPDAAFFFAKPKPRRWSDG